MPYTTKPYKVSFVKPRSWDSIHEYYANLIAHGWKHEPMLELVQHIRSIDLSQRLFAYTSLDTMLITIDDHPEWCRNTLEIRFDREKELFLFRYFSMPYDKPEFVRQYPREKGIEKFEQFIRLIKW